jgi:hypothetical protein
MKKTFLLTAVILGLTFNAAVFAQKTVPAALQAALFYKIFDFDESLSESSGPQIIIGIFYDPNNDKSTQAKEDMKQAFLDLSDKTIGGKKVLIKEITDASQLTGLNIIYVTPGNDSLILDIVKKCEAGKVFGITGTEDYVRKGLPVAVAVENNKAKIIVNRTQAALCGVKLSSKLLALAQLI